MAGKGRGWGGAVNVNSILPRWNVEAASGGEGGDRLPVERVLHYTSNAWNRGASCGDIYAYNDMNTAVPLRRKGHGRAAANTL